MSKFDELKRLAESANRASDGSPWAYEAHGDTGDYGVGILENDQGDCVQGRQEAGQMLVLEPVAPEVNGQAFAAFIAAANPATILSLIAEVERLTAENECLRVDNSSLRGSCKALGDESKHIARRVRVLHRAVTWLASTGRGVKRPVWLERILAKEAA